MKYSMSFLLIACQLFSYGQQTGIFKIDSLPPTGILLDSGWAWHQGDDAEWAKPGNSNSGWKEMHPEKFIVDALAPAERGSAGWLRLHFTMPVYEKENYALMIEQSGATQIFFNGEKIKEYGVIDNEKKQIKAFNPLGKPLLIFPKTTGVQILAVRYYFQPGMTYRNIFNLQHFFFRAKLIKNGNAVNIYSAHRAPIIEGFNVGFCLVFFITHFILYLFYPVSKSNLLFSLWAFFSLIGNIYFVKQYSSNFVEVRSFNAVVVLIAFMFANMSLTFSLYLLLKQKIRLLILVIFLLYLSNAFITLYGDNNVWSYISFCLEILGPLLILIIAFNGVRQKVSGAYIIAGGAICYIVFWTAFSLSFLLNMGPNINDITFHLADFVFPVSISLVLGLEFRFINKSLTQKLKDIEILALEKQQILALQNQTLEQQVTERTSALNQSLENLKSTQSQLIQKEKMASLGELTAGIAHEIQNPLNFVNNFSDVNKELLIEMQDEMDKGNIADAKEIASDVIANEEKINHHGKRADAIVKGMLQHSRSSTGVKEPTDINALADEYLRLSYHGLRAKDKSFNATLKTDFDETIGNINIIPQDIGRVILNLITNAFYAVNEKNLSAVVTPAAVKYEPTVSISTKKLNEKVEIKVTDNGSGIPQKIVDKIFQPFFTTKPTGQGTGLGLSLSYDIVKAHNGELKVETKEGEGATFILSIPITNNNI